MKEIFSICIFPLLALTACQNMPIDFSGFSAPKRPLNLVELEHPKIKLTFQATGKTHRSGDTFDPPNTIDCSKLTLKSDSFKGAIEAGALLVKIKTPRKVKIEIQTPQQTQRFFEQKSQRKQEQTYETVKIKPFYGGVLALCNVSESATGPDSRSYRIRSLDEYFVKGKNGHVAVVGAVLGGGFAKSYSWMLWISDRTTTFTNYEDDWSIRKASIVPK